MYILGLDCGGTSTEALLITLDGYTLGHGRGGPANYTVSGVDGIVKSVLEATKGCLELARFDLLTLQQEGIYLALGVSGAGRRSEVEEIKKAFHDLGFEHVVVSHDATIALLGALSGADGVAVIAGTGSIAYGLHGERSYRAGGWGYLLGDEGSAFWIGLRALQQVMRGYDGRTNYDRILFEATRDYFQIQDTEALIPLVYNTPINRSLVGGFSKKITSLATSGHSLSQNILADAGQQLGQLAVAVLAELDLLERKGRVGACGGVFSAGDWVLIPMQEEIYQRAPDQVLTLPDFRPVGGAILLATRHFGLDLDRVKAGLTQGM